MFAEYKRVCRLGLASGGLFEWRSPGGSWIYNLATQPRPGRCARVAHVVSAVSRMVAHARAAGVRRIGLPRIGCGYGGLDYRDVRPVLLAAADDLDLVVVERKR
jgi:O-acetyl-ADP-ribose deacetylase (regulator of RNase III)